MTFHPPKLGVGMIYATALRPFLERRPDALDVLEIEPQTLWLADDPIDGPFFEFTPGVDLYAELPGHKLVHSVGVPLGGTRSPDNAHLALLRQTAERLGSPWVSEHLSIAGTPHQSAGFLLPPLQTEAGVAQAVANITKFAGGVGRPVAVETGVSYLSRKPFEMPDGCFVSQVVESADCGILLDLHNLYCNHRNGRLDWDEFLSQIPLERVWEVHLAGGEERDGFWLDSHSGTIPDDLTARSLEVLQSLPNLGALNFEIFDTFLERFTNEEFDRTVDDLRYLWSETGAATTDARPAALAPPASRPAPDPAKWDAVLTDAVWKAEAQVAEWEENAEALTLYAFLARSFRGSILARSLPRLLRYLLLRDGPAVEERLKRFYKDSDPKLYAPLECKAFANWLRRDGEADAWALALLDYDIALLEIIRRGAPIVVSFPGDPTTVFEGLATRDLAKTPPPQPWEVEILPDVFAVEDFAQASPS